MSNSLNGHKLACQVLLSMEFPGKNTRVGCYFLLQRIFPSLGQNTHFLHLLYCLVDSLPLCQERDTVGNRSVGNKNVKKATPTDVT